MCYRGTQTLAGHFEKPGETQRFELAVELTQHAVALSTWSADAPEAVEREVLWVDRNAVIHVPSDGPARRASAWEASWARKLVAPGLPARVERATHPTFGDVVERVQPGESNLLAGLSAPASLVLAHANESTQWSAELVRERCAIQATLGDAPPTAAEPARTPQPVTWHKLDDGVELALLQDSEIASLVVELPDSLVVCEAGLTVQQGEQLVDALAQRFPGKPVAHVLFSHHHPHYTGGLRAFIAAGAVIHAPVHNAQFVEQLAALAFELAPDRLARNKRAARVEPFEGKLTLQVAGRVVLEAIDIGAESNHTAEYVVSYLPQQKLLFEADLGWFAEPTGQIRASRRAQGLLQAISARGLAVDRLAQSWPLMGANQVLERGALEAAVKARDTP